MVEITRDNVASINLDKVLVDGSFFGWIAEDGYGEFQLLVANHTCALNYATRDDAIEGLFQTLSW